MFNINDIVVTRGEMCIHTKCKVVKIDFNMKERGTEKIIPYGVLPIEFDELNNEARFYQENNLEIYYSEDELLKSY